MFGHIRLYLSVIDPADSRLQIFLTNRRTREIVTPESIRRTTRLAEVSLRVREPCTRIDGISEFLISELLTCDIDSLEPVKLLAVIAFTEVYHQFVVEYLFSLYIFEIVKGLKIDREFPYNIITDTDSPLLSVEDFVGIISVGYPVHDIEWEVLAYGLDH